ncbi:MAG: DUF1617 family protein [Streptococcaceae bacterium]|nr:DUF1617 family protein [Streptococcaceae bacterium]MCL2680905.1 DUF1617 family protein [Streptococcaceae bacterium]MCL2858101.1 DUF1617 family protein [Streptococcaceae bacterium]
MIIKLYPQELLETTELIFGLKLSGAVSRHRTKIVNQFKDKFQEYDTDRLELIQKYADLDSDGQPKQEDGHFVFSDKEKEGAFLMAFNELYGELLSVNLSEYSLQVQSLLEALNNYSETFSGKEAEVFDLICEKLERG